MPQAFQMLFNPRNQTNLTNLSCKGPNGAPPIHSHPACLGAACEMSSEMPRESAWSECTTVSTSEISARAPQILSPNFCWKLRAYVETTFFGLLESARSCPSAHDTPLPLLLRCKHVPRLWFLLRYDFLSTAIAQLMKNMGRTNLKVLSAGNALPRTEHESPCRPAGFYGSWPGPARAGLSCNQRQTCEPRLHQIAHGAGQAVARYHLGGCGQSIWDTTQRR